MPQGDAELMAEEQVLDFKPAPRLAEVDEEHCERLQEGEHRPRSCNDSTRRCDPSRMEFSESIPCRSRFRANAGLDATDRFAPAQSARPPEEQQQQRDAEID